VRVCKPELWRGRRRLSGWFWFGMSARANNRAAPASRGRYGMRLAPNRWQRIILGKTLEG
jgi:hypothetical protein